MDWRRLLDAALAVWPEERYFTVAVFARYVVEDPGDGERYRLAVRDAYGHRVPISPGRRYYGWRGETLNRSQLEQYGHLIVPDVLETFGGRRPVHAVSVRPVDPTR